MGGGSGESHSMLSQISEHGVKAERKSSPFMSTDGSGSNSNGKRKVTIYFLCPSNRVRLESVDKIDQIVKFFNDDWFVDRNIFLEAVHL